MPRAYSEAGMSLIEVVVLFVAVGFFVIAAAPLFSRFLQVRTSVDYTLWATVLAQDIMERIRGKSFEELKAKVNAEGWKLNNSDFRRFLYGDDPLPSTLPPEAEEMSRVIIRWEDNNPNGDTLVVEIEIKWQELLRISREMQERTYRVATRVYEKGIQTLRKGGT
ncbi:type IV pilus modification PilV family protein [Candidatus Caldatribacterium saccharofermentans]|uniref:type IV pilus modification PilV family protein n=1 Tax=Candidatus Caldatribacterium saccharofermentans TaxID=1454753 RepID=UPI003D00DD17